MTEQEIQHSVIHGERISGMGDGEWETLLSKKEVLFARTTPEQKLIIVEKFTSAGNIVAMTGGSVYRNLITCFVQIKANI